ncbi:MAG TPA: hypothetical protein VLB86_08515 [Gaiellaceae bacterium]|nr:hypothetical protein [Gaiellaceae bacterium]
MRARAALACGGIAAFLGVLLALDQLVSLRGQVLLGLVTALALMVALRAVSPELRAQTLVVVVVATGGELVGSILWGLYTYRLENLPAFVPPAHGLVYLGGVALATLAAGRERLLVGLALAAVLSWGLAGVTVLPREDVGGLLGAFLLALFLLRGRAPATYAGVFVMVAALELYGTALGTWRWAEVAPGTSITQGNPPSGIASGYVFFDVAALALAPLALTLIRRGRRSRTATAAPLPDPARSA